MNSNEIDKPSEENKGLVTEADEENQRRICNE